MCTCITDRRRTARKEHRCLCCNQKILKGEVYHNRVGVEHGEGWVSMKMHTECEKATRGWGDDDWEVFSPGEMERPTL